MRAMYRNCGRVYEVRVTVRGRAGSERRAGATGSMADELQYISAAVADIARIRATHSDLSIRFALIVYRDAGDEYVTCSFEFTPISTDSRQSRPAVRRCGGPHEEPHIPCYQVELLDGLLMLTILSELAGAHLPPAMATSSAPSANTRMACA